MKNYFSFLVLSLFAFCAVLLLLLLSSAGTTNADIGDTQLLMAFNAGFQEVIESGEYDEILEKWGVADLEYDQCLPESSPLNVWPEKPEGLFEAILVQSKVIAIGQDTRPYPPFWNGTTGLDEDLAKAIIRRIGIHYNVPSLSMKSVRPTIEADFFQSLYQNLENLGSDLIMSHVGVTPYRKQFVDFTCPYLNTYPSIVRCGLDPEKNLTTPQMLNDPSVKVAVQKGSIYEQFAATNLTRATVFIRDNLQATLSMVADEEVHVALTTSAFVAGLRPTFTTLAGNTLQNCTIHLYGEVAPIAACVRKAHDGLSSESGAVASSSAAKLVVLVAAFIASAFILSLVA